MSRCASARLADSSATARLIPVRAATDCRGVAGDLSKGEEGVPKTPAGLNGPRGNHPGLLERPLAHGPFKRMAKAMSAPHQEPSDGIRQRSGE